jgi:DNA-binding transcriptional LysR family regulator
MHITLDALVVLDAIARGGSFARGAERLYRVPSAVSYSVHKLEQDLGVTIFDRSGHRAKLTEAGTQLLEEGRKLLQQASEIEKRVRRVHSGWQRTLTIILGDMVVTSAIYPILKKFHDVPGHQPIEVCVEVGPQAVCWERLAAGYCDIAIGAPSLGSADEAYDVQPLGQVQLTLAMPHSHPLARAREPVPNKSLAQHRIVRQAAWALGASLELQGAEYTTVADSTSQVDAIRHGLGIGFVPSYMVQDDVAAGRLVTKRVVKPPEPCTGS